MTAPRTIVIAGAGIGGLTAALALAARGFRILICEKTGRLEEAGAGLQLSPNATRVLIGLGLQPRLAPHVTTPASVSIMTARSGGEVISLPLGSADDHAPYWLVHRADLQSALLGAVAAHPDIELRLGCPVDNLRTTHAGITVNGEPALALIGADGAWSFVRRQLFPETQPHFSGLIAWRGTLETRRLGSALIPRGVQLWMGPKAHLVVYPVSSGERINMVAIMPGAALPPGGSDKGDASEISRHFAASRWPANARAMIDSIDNWRRWPLFTIPDGGMWHEGPVALLGDAAHAMLPFAAQGAGMAIEDAAVLAQCIGTVGDDAAAIAPALARYAALRQPRVIRIQRTATQSGRIYHLRGPMALARDLAMRALGAQRLQARQDWIYNWRL
ncbi:FAD-dependent monooxygenase [Tardiphaga sp. P9-11]|uniref:FAD-dependent monooxygenase n=1 Tax=Tardiphaga sp. P9-11 TaxID=2024614 RepID=UPI0011F26C3D|nr:FAD-dependent monooxygenase [Tardiphaga sp. P9-11]KAA0076436.1 FAD-binding protein [Tardiphaga sp. P9-11]